MTEAVIVATARSPIGRAAKGSLVSIRPDDLSAQIVKALMAKVPNVSASDVEDLIMGCGQPAGEAGFNIARITAVLAGLDDAEITALDRWIRRHTTERFGPVREVTHEPDEGLVFEVAFEGLQKSTRHKSGLAMRFPRISRLRWDKPPKEADRLETLERMLERGGSRVASPLAS